MADAPQVVYASPDLEIDRTHEHPHTVHQSCQTPEPPPVRSPWPARATQGKSDDETALPVSRSLGFQRRKFWVLCVVAVILIGGTIGGSIGGVLAVQSSRYGGHEAGGYYATDLLSSARGQPVVSVTMADTNLSQTPSTVTSKDAAIAAASTITNSLSSSSLNAATPTLTIDNSCPSTLRSYNSKLYDCVAKRNANEVGDIIAILAYTLQQCVDACSNMNIIAGSVKCRAVAMTNGLDYEYQNNIAANCWLKSASQPSQQWDNATLAVLITDGE
ncbi:uncharacterized protein yc1106_07450 [Curvularia clavata]|uniref:Apple domain-containing protein n=1 Tax=Curvularia clavata TaxID=95742 RepID=A0A9Q8ZDJ1_CURCL|nr:uncharacterized protein yc1106_07450 [Curvularia clavata]